MKGRAAEHQAFGAPVLLPAAPSFGFVRVTALLCWLEPLNVNLLMDKQFHVKACILLLLRPKMECEDLHF